MLLAFNIAQTVLAIACLALLGQGALYVLAGAKRQDNAIYQLFQVLNKPWVKAARFIAPRQIANSQVPFVAFFVLSVLYGAVTIAKIEHCIAIGVALCKSA